MDKTIERMVEKTETIHRFYCDTCNKFLGESEEWDDGYYEPVCCYRNSVSINNSHFYLHKTLCDECRYKFDKELNEEFKTLLNKYGFEE